jgi:hypothetical protein
MLWVSAGTNFEWLLHSWPYLLGGIAGILAWLIYQMRSRQAQSWPVVDGTVESHLFYVEGFGQHRHQIAEVSYSYGIDREYYSGAHKVSGEFEFAYFPKGSRVMVHYKPSDPSTSFLDREEVRLRKLRRNPPAEVVLQ